MPRPATSAPRRRRRDPRETEREILDAAEELLRGQPFRDVTVEAVMLRTGLKRPAFYAHFRDRYELVLRVVQSIETKLFEQADKWLRTEGAEGVAAAVEGVVEVYRSDGPVLRALADASASDARMEEAYRGLVRAFIDANAKKIRAEQRAGLVPRELPAAETARALVWLFERYLGELFGGRGEGDSRLAAQVLTHLCRQTLYGTPPAVTGHVARAGATHAGARPREPRSAA